jgi:hypothetical protein
VAKRVRVREIDDDEGKRLVRIVRRDTGSVVTWRRAHLVLLVSGVLHVPAHALHARDTHRAGHRQFLPAPEYQAGPPGRVWAEANNVELVYTPTNSSWLNRIEAQFTALRYFALDGLCWPPHQRSPTEANVA